MRTQRNPGMLAGLAVMDVAAVAFVAWAPAALSLALSVAAAVAWCLWLDRYPGP